MFHIVYNVYFLDIPAPLPLPGPSGMEQRLSHIVETPRSSKYSEAEQISSKYIETEITSTPKKV